MKTAAFILLALSLILQSCSDKEAAAGDSTERKIGLLLVNHGSRSETWRNTLVKLEENVKDRILASGDIKGSKTAFMEYNEPSIATRLKEFDAEGYTDIIIVPLFLTVSPHTFDDIPTIIGKKEDPQSKEMMKLEKIERYTPKAKTHITPLLDFTEIMKENVLRRVKNLSSDPQNEGLVLIGYGDETYDNEWVKLFTEIAEYVKSVVGIDKHSHGWCGHIVRYSLDSTTTAINRVLDTKEKAVVIPVLVAHDENFQIRIIGGGIQKVPNHEKRVIYKPDAILPDENVEQWVIDITKEYVIKVKSGG